LEDFLTVLKLHQRGLETLDCPKDLFPKVVVTDRTYCLLEDVVSKLVIDEFLNDETNSTLQILPVVEAKLLHDLVVVLRESALEYLLNVGFCLQIQTCVKALLNDVAGKLELTKSDEVFGNLAKDHSVLALIVELEDVLDKVVAVGIFDEVGHMDDNVICKFQLLLERAFFETSLHHTATMLVFADFNTVVHAGVEDKLSILGRRLSSLIGLI
jgi:hypothetical protein